jgi:hypothetical protein
MGNFSAPQFMELRANISEGGLCQKWGRRLSTTHNSGALVGDTTFHIQYSVHTPCGKNGASSFTLPNKELSPKSRKLNGCLEAQWRDQTVLWVERTDY